MITFNGLPIYESVLVADVPKLKLRSEAPVTDQLRADFDEWLKHMFGCQPVAICVNGALYVSPTTMHRLKKEAYAEPTSSALLADITARMLGRNI